METVESSIEVVDVRVDERTKPKYRFDSYATRWYLNGDWRSYEAKPRVYVWFKDESVGANLVTRFERKPNRYRPYVKAVLADLGVEYDKLAWGQKAGCSCGCSPGYVLTLSKDESGRTIWPECAPKSGRFDIHITIDAERLSDLITEQGIQRLAALVGDREAKRVAKEAVAA